MVFTGHLAPKDQEQMATAKISLISPYLLALLRALPQRTATQFALKSLARINFCADSDRQAATAP